MDRIARVSIVTVGVIVAMVYMIMGAIEFLRGNDKKALEYIVIALLSIGAIMVLVGIIVV